MGVPKFFRWMSERYPAISQLIAENRIPEFDALYLDMNGIIHNCTHKDSDSPTYRMSEEKMFIAIFNYIEHLFGKIKPQKLFFMAIDGVAPRAKMNQQRARRFRTALDAENAHKKAIQQGIEMPKEDPFDSNCITPGTEFMANLTKQLKYFINKKVSEDVDWQGVEIILSGHEVPGEGEHKIMEYIRLAKAQPGYDANVRHCLYGLDADLIMLGLLSHDPHFCLLREEVTFGRQNQKKSKELEHQNFYLMHLSIVREYLELEFQDLIDGLGEDYDFERILDDFILLAFFVGNDFLPNLPGLHINEGALALMFRIYKSVIMKSRGYINENGVINLERLGLVLDEMSQHEFRVFESENSDAHWLKGKQVKEVESLNKGLSLKGGKTVMSSGQKEIYKSVKEFIQNRKAAGAPRTLDLPNTLRASDRKFVEDLAGMVRLQCGSVQDENGDRHMRLSFFPNAGGEDDDEEDDEEGEAALHRVFKALDKAKIVDISAEEARAEIERVYQDKFHEWRNSYYKDKFGFGLDDKEEIQKLTQNYVEGLQWVLHYYYSGVASWPWFYRYHYSPKITDIKEGLGANLNFTLGTPFRPFEQLMGVLPDRSKKIVPTAYHELMMSPDSPIIDFYPRDFELDMNGKKMEWEAVVKIPFIEEKRLLTAMRSKEAQLTDDERGRNEFGVTMKFTYSPDVDFTYESSMQSVFPDITHCHCVENIFELPTLEGGLELIVGLCDGVKLGSTALAGFPSLKTLEHSGQLGFHGVNVFQQDSRNESMVVTLHTPPEVTQTETAKLKIGAKVHVGYPFLQEAKIFSMSDELFKYTLDDSGNVIQTPCSGPESDAFRRKSDRIEGTYSKRMGMIIGPVEIIYQVEMLKGLIRTDEGAMVKEYGNIPGIDAEYAAQTVVDSDFISEDQRFLEKEAVDISEEFPAGTRAFLLGDYAYGRPLEVINGSGDKADVWVSTMKGKEPDIGRLIAQNASRASDYVPSFAVAKMLGLNGLVLSKITSSFSVLVDEQRQNLGLNLKFEAKKLKVLGYSRKGDSGWEFSSKAINLLTEYIKKFPEFFQGIQRKPTADIYHAEDFYPPNIAKQKIKEIQLWLKEIESKNFEKVPLDAEQLDGSAVMEIEAKIDEYNANTPPGENKRIKGVPRKALLKPSDAEHRLHYQKFALGDRIVYVQDSGKVPIATKGTVVGIAKTSRTTLLDIVFDVSFMSGSTLGDRCSPFRGMTIPFSSALNLSNRQLSVITKASATAGAKKNGGVGETMEIHGNGYRAAPPPPTLTGSWTGAIQGTNPANPPGPRHFGGRGGFQPRGRGRGRGGSGNGSGGAQGNQPNPGFKPTIQQRPQQGHHNANNPASQGQFGNQQRQHPSQPKQAQYFNQVPPPPILDANGGNRGRGGAGGRGYRGRGDRGGSGRGRGRGRGGGAQFAPPAQAE